MWSVSVGVRWQGARDAASLPTPAKAAAAAAAAAAGRAAAAAAVAGVGTGTGGGGGSTAGGGREGGRSRGGVAAMLYYTLDPQFGALLYSVASRYERFALLPDSLACCAYAGPPAPTEVLAYAHALGIQLYTLGENYACFLTQVRAGSVIFLVGVGSLVCWKLWEHWRSGGGPSSPPPSPTHSPSPPQRRPRSILASLLEDDLVQDFEDFDDEDPALIHHLIELGREFVVKLLVGKYFGPDSPSGEGPGEDLSLVSSEVSEVSEVFAHHYLADASASISAGDVGSSSGENSLPTDEDSDVELFGGHKRVVRRKHRSSELHRNQLTPSHGRAPGGGGRGSTAAPNASTVAKKHKTESKHAAKRQGTGQHPLQEDWCSSESSPAHGAPTSAHLPQVKELTRHLGDGSETPDSEGQVGKRRHQCGSALRSSQTRDQEDLLVDSRLQPEGEEESHLSTNISSASLSDLMEKMRHRGCHGSISRDNSIASNMSDFVTSPQGSKRFTFKREDSVCSNLSDFAPSECSEMSLDVSVRDDLACKTFTYLDDIEHELDDLKSSMLEMDEEVTKFASKPNPYTFKTTYSDYSITSGDSRPSSALDLVNAHRSRASFRGVLGQKGTGSSDSEALEGGPAESTHSQGHVVSGSEAEGSFEWDSPQHGWSSARGPPLSRLPELPSEDAESSRASTQEDMMPSLEWDNDCLQQYDEEQMQDSHNSQLDEVFHRNTCESFAELEGYEEYKLSCSRSSGLASSSEISPATPDSESAGWASWERRLGPGEFGTKARRYWSSEESGYMEGTDTPLDTAVHAHLSPVHEIKEKEYSESSGSSPTHHTNPREVTSEGGNLNETALESNLNGNLIMGSTASTANDNEHILGITTSAFGNQPNVAIGQRIEVARYASQEWRGNTAKAHTIKQGYSAIPVELNYHYLRRVRGDNYCGVRATLYQILSLGLPVPSGHATHTRLAAELNQGSTWLRDWSFGHRLSFSKEQVLNGFWECLEALDSMVLSLKGCENRECVVLSRLNSDPLLDVKLCEAVKLHMLATALDLHIGNNNGDNVPLFSMIMFARHTSLTPRDFVKNHLNLVGDTAGLEQDQHKIEMFLMGHTLGVTLQVVRPACYGKDDFICYYPDANIGVWPEVTLVAEDDRHYNVLIK
ncbi:uncharacterized protein LOC125046403 isoform X5 [Penaeus chinensis]|uniref:uncharacterized protein LOC125046403 isoform X5 n=1 Tax=Penaeus chinensis TaxID=139456 RepID=UPI001FB74F83|nr:uncharacterized protein LOC125046403 isoform X5 [Penaeus chinensis]